MKLTEVEIRMTADELLRALWFGERSDNQISFGLSGLPEDWKIKYISSSRDTTEIRITIECRLEEPQADAPEHT